MRSIIGSCKFIVEAILSWSCAYYHLRYHDENTKEEDLIHPEDIAHFREHDEHEDEQDRIAAMDRLSIVEKNIPQKFLRT